MLTELIDLGWTMKEQMKDTQNEIKQNIQGINSYRKETKTQSNYLEQKEEINIQPEQNEETRIQKSEEIFTNLWDNLKRSNIRIIGVPEGAEQKQEIENLFEQIMKENLPKLVKEIDFQEVQEAQRVPKKLDPNRNTPRHIIIKLSKIKGKETILKAAKGKQRVTDKGVPIRLSAYFSKETLQARRAGKKYLKSWKARTYIQDYSIQQSYHLEWKGRLKCFPDKFKVKGVHYHQALIIWNVKGTYLRNRRWSKIWRLKWQQTHSC